ncbi:Tol biopolymer transport system component [Friedmanniella endophytica]|uniref:Tol biopolymer transport system component n=1 Tax=Microlunatus kandeliicorticis TaxID=1759536 RepID=A0A7W3IT68_9ACTN|nr:biopolymer transporter Tol [Microlunatus kandeliicorticis]MBA8794801.1 Tol biopolymer transport system component [Microlunatus kandeliicorticis]
MARTLAPGQQTEITIGFTDGRPPELVHRSSEVLLEAPNWTVDGEALIVNGDGVLWRLPVAGGEPVRIALDVPELNNDHVLHPDGEQVVVSANDGHLYLGSLSGGAARRITDDHRTDHGRRFFHFLHGISPDGRTLASIGLELGADGWTGARTADVYLVDVATGAETRLTHGEALTDGCEFSPDGEWIYLNTEAFARRPGHAQIARMRPDGSGLEQLTDDDRVNWFPHWEPSGRLATFISFPTGTEGHPADLPVELKLVRDHDWAGAETVVSLFGGQGTINVNSWAPTGDRFGYVAYPV